jgi:TonB family protein
LTGSGQIVLFDKSRARNASWNTGAVVSFAIHCCVLVGIPLLLQLTKSTVRFERPPTFQLVSAPPTLKPIEPVAQKKHSPEQHRKKAAAQPVPNASGAKEENVDELASLLDELPPPASIAAVGNFKYNWYLAQVQEKVERNWNPSTENRADSVVVAFTINSDGSISEPSIFRGSQNGTINDLALRAVKLAAPFSKLPPGVPENKYDMLCTLRPARK